ncbi:flavin reductase like domain-containing protein [Pisolithus thermaeus]|nr:flavin reductase like domain-containing protein [Pisolithus thermaeus]
MLSTCLALGRRNLPRRSREYVRCITTPSIADTEHTREQLRQLLRETAQSVVVVTTLVPSDPRADTNGGGCEDIHVNAQGVYHGTTLSSFTSIALDPLPLVAFSLRIPSRMATALNTHVNNLSNTNTAHMVINILSAAQPDLAVKFSRPDLHPRPLEDSDVQWSRSEEGFPILSGTLGALSCTLISRSLPLGDLRWVPGRHPSEQIEECGGFTSELFIARVSRVERVPRVDGETENDRLRTLPLLYHRRKYATSCDIPSKS